MVRRLCVAGTLVAAGVLWPACSGEQSLDVDGPIPCSSTADCYDDGKYALGTQCIDGVCKCPFKGDELCCRPGFEEDGNCDRMCRPAAECAGAAMACHTAEECPGPEDTRCGVARCTQGICKLQLAKEIESQLRGDCKVIKCDDRGATFEETAPKDIFNDGNQCTTDLCSGAGVVNSPREEGPAPESSGFCDGQGRLVECTSDLHCGNPAIKCSPLGRCVPSWCDNGVKDSTGGESSIDCGGPCDPCKTGQACQLNTDCRERICGSNKKCTPATCDDGMLNDSETDVDCGSASCSACLDGAGCASHAGCRSGVCWAGICQIPNCDDGVENGLETGIDCGTSCEPCLL
jgi:hypothetical protein